MSRGLAAGALLLVAAGGGRAAGADPGGFRAAIAPVLLDRCVSCHNAKKSEGGYRLDTAAWLVQAGESGEPPLVAGAEPGGEILRRIEAADPEERMPPDGPALSPEEVQGVREWLRAGADMAGVPPALPLLLVVPPWAAPAPPSYPFPVPVTALSFSPDGTRLVVGGYRELLVFTVADAALERRIGGVSQRTTAIRFLGDGRQLAVAGGRPGRDGDVRIVDLATGTITRVLARGGDVVPDVAARPGTAELAVASVEGLVRLCDAETGADTRAISSHGDWVTAVAYSDDGGRLASASRDRTVKVYDAVTGGLLANFGDHAAATRGAAFTADGRELVSAGDDRHLRRFSVETGKQVAAVPLGGEGFTPLRDGGLVHVAVGGLPVRSIDLARNAVVRQLAEGGAAIAVAVHGASGRIATGSIDGQVRLLDATDGRLLRAWAARP